MRHPAPLLALILLSAPGLAAADSPRLLFDRSQIALLQQRVAQPAFAPIWAKILADAEAYCDPQSPRYTDPANPCVLPQKKTDRMDQKRHDALLVHIVGRNLTQRMESIGLAYQLTGRKALGQHGAALLLATLEQYPVTNPLVAKGFAGGRGDIMRGLALGYDMLADCLDETQRQRVATACAEYLDQAVREFDDPKLWWHKVHNYNGVNGGAAGCLALALHDVYPEQSQAWVAACVNTVQRWLETAFDAQGAYVEGVGYSGYGLSNTVLFADALRRNGQANLFALPVFRKLPEFYALSLLPGERVYDARNDSAYAGLGGMLLKLAEGCDHGLYQWLWENSGSDHSLLRILWANEILASDPVTARVPQAQHFQGRGLCVWRTGWTKNDVMFSIEAGPYYRTTHNQADKGHFTLYGLGYRWATDPGYANEHERQGRGQTLGHSCILIDGQGQALSGAGWGTNGTIARYENHDRFGYALADCTEAYNRNSAGKPGAEVQFARRHAFFVYPRQGSPAYAVVLDDIRKDDQPHDFTWQMMYSDRMAATLAEGRAVFEPVPTSGNAYVDSPADSPRTNRAACRLSFTVAQRAEYALWARVRTPAEESLKSDSFFVALDDNQPIDWHMGAHPEWTWLRVTSGVKHAPVSFPLGAGEHRLVVRMREAGAQIDCLVFAQGEEVAPSLATAACELLFLEAEGGQLTAPMRIVPSPSSEPRLVARIHACSNTALSKDVFRPVDCRAPAAFPRFRATVRAVNPRFMAVLLPLPAAMPEPAVAFDATKEARVITVAWPEHTDKFTWPETEDTARFSQSP